MAIMQEFRLVKYYDTHPMLRNVPCYPRQHIAFPSLPSVLQVTSTNVDIAKVAPNYHLYTSDEVEAVIARL